MNVYEEAAVELRRRGWTRGTLVDGRGRVCIQGACSAVLGRLQTGKSDEEYLTDKEALPLLVAIDALGFGRRFALDPSAAVYLWNDDDARTEEDVLLVLKHAAADA